MTTGTTDQALRAAWQQARQRLDARQLLGGARPGLSLRIPGTDTMWFGSAADDAEPRCIAWRGPPDGEAGLHALVYARRDDVCALASGGGDFGLRLADFGGCMPGVFDEQVRHLGHMPAALQSAGQLPAALAGGTNVLMLDGRALVLGMTATRLMLNAELFEKCAKAYVLALAAGGPLRPLPWIVRHVANRRLLKDEQRARERTRQGLLPEESQGY
ncbi:hypothetical protein [Roseateles saccharophilus]|uniref:Ribulose-5-phosphate 4-epimerase/fuculose-1-phosphate aldolase n=1 Tax=Roseateles saccharophilus TaxID=304 RepID=A0A4R3UX49_ROSSA|nr:hypothetical protein [Roseateles saccharophilus]MDG0832697.1 hypothetical protein [Roseateles saccharophilus]TCU95367.1 ribulose-5-phosphate 4-epimerase/fuculose-1-phosphate aldolase [Roseateles saccharophilus]